MKAFHGSQEIKDKYIARVRKHRKVDNLVQGLTWKNGKGCAIGCTLENYSHEQFETELGIPGWFAHLEDKIFEGLDKADAQMWPENVLKAIPVGCDVEKLKNKILIVIVKEARSHVDEGFEGQLKAIDRVLDCLESNASKEELKKAAADTGYAGYAGYAASAAGYAADASAVGYAAASAGYAAAAGYAADADADAAADAGYAAADADADADAGYAAADAAADAGYAAADAAGYAAAADAGYAGYAAAGYAGYAASAARQKSYKRMADGILKVLKNR